MTDLKSTYDRIAQFWAEEHDGQTWWHAGTEAFVDLLPKRGKVLDVGCGDGQKSSFLLHQGCRVLGVDFSTNMIQLARRKAPNGTFRVLDLAQLDSLLKDFDGVYASAILLHVRKRDVNDVFVSMVRRLRPDGFLYLTVKEIRPGQPEELTITETEYGFPVKRFYSFFTLTELVQDFSRAGLKIIQKKAVRNGSTRWLQIIGQKSQ